MADCDQTVDAEAIGFDCLTVHHQSSDGSKFYEFGPWFHFASQIAATAGGRTEGRRIRSALRDGRSWLRYSLTAAVVLPPAIQLYRLSAPRLSSERNSSRATLLLRNSPSMALVTVWGRCFSTPRIIIQKWLASHLTATPRGAMASWIASATCWVRRSCTCSRRANMFTIRGILLSPMTFFAGKYAT